MEREAAEALFVRDIYPGMVSPPAKHAACPQAVAVKLPGVLGQAVQYAWRREQQHPFSLFFALRGALKHKKMHLFRAVDKHGMEFVMAKVPAVLDVQHAVPELKQVIDFITTHHGTTRSELLKTLGTSDAVMQQLNWVTDRGHVIEYFNGVLVLPEDHPYFRQVKEASAEHPAKSPETTAEAPAATPVAETPAEAEEPVPETEPPAEPAEPVVEPVATETPVEPTSEPTEPQ